MSLPPAISLSDDSQISKLPNGLTVATSTMPGAASVAIGFWINVGTRHEPEEANGVAHLVEHMMFKGTTTRSALEIAVALEDVGGQMNAYTSREQTAYYARVLPENTELALDILADMLLNSTCTEEELVREREVIVQEIGEITDQPGEFLDYELHKQTYPDQKFGKSILGDPALIAQMPRDQVMDYVKKHYHAGNIILAASGAVTHADIVALAEKYAGTFPAAPAATDAVPQFTPATLHIEREIEQVTLSLIWPGPSYLDTNTWAYDVASQILGDGFSSRLFQEVREKRGLVYSIGASTTNYSDSGTFSIYASATPANCPDVLTVTADVLKSFAPSITAEELTRAKAQLRATLMISHESVGGRADRLATHLQVFGRVVPLAEMIAHYEAVTLEDVQAVIADILAAPLATGLIGPLNAIETIPDFTAALKAA